MLISVKVIPRSKRNSVEWESGVGGEGERLRVRLTAAPVDGAANEALVALLAERLGLPKRQVVRGATSRQKVVEVVGLNLEDLKRSAGVNEVVMPTSPQAGLAIFLKDNRHGHD